MIEKLWVQNFGPYEKASVDLDDFTVILGANGSGKSLLFGALKAIGRVAKHPLRFDRRPQNFGGYPTRTGQVPFDDIVHKRDISRTVVLGVKFTCDGVSGEYEVHLAHWNNTAGAIMAERLDVQTPHGAVKVDVAANGRVESNVGTDLPYHRLKTPRFVSVPGLLFKSRDPKETAIGADVQRALSDSVSVYRLDPTALKAPAEVGRTLSPTGYGFAEHLDRIRNEPGGKQEFEAMLDRFRLACPHVEDILLPSDDRTSASEAPRKRIALVMPGTPSATIPADLESDGTILLLAYASLLHGSRSYSTLCIEEPENGIHPRVMPKQVKMLRSMTQAYNGRPACQVLVCTHSYALYNEVKHDPTKLRLVSRGGDGRSQVERPSERHLASLPGWAGLT